MRRSILLLVETNISERGSILLLVETSESEDIQILRGLPPKYLVEEKYSSTCREEGKREYSPWTGSPG